MNTYNNNQSPIEKENFIWIAEYNKEDIHKRLFLPEYEFVNGGFGNLNHKFNEIEKDKLSYLGYIGNDYKFFYNVQNGMFNAYDCELEVKYYDSDNDKEYIFMNSSVLYNDIILYKTLANDYDASNGKQDVSTLEYGFGYKEKINDFYIEAVFHIPMIENKPTFFSFKIVSPKDINGELRFYLNNKLAGQIKSGLIANYGKTFKMNIN